ncbi:MAG TPA: outer membrane beta-barrel protein [Bacteroidota bacterium]|nr:outer membrane beta-barrel protein [Bacteroidota bacterium]
MKNLLCLVVLVACVGALSQAQDFIAVQAEIAEPTDAFRQSAGTGYGVKATYMHFLSSHLALSGSGGYTRWGSRSDVVPFNDYSIVSVPVLLGGHLLLSRGVVAPYAGVELGLNYLHERGTAPNTTASVNESEIRFVLRPHVGVGVHVAGPLGVLLTGSYNVIYTRLTPSKFFALSIGIAASL